MKEPVFLFDLDGTLTKEELFPRISRLSGIEKEMTILTDETILGNIPFEKSLRMRVDMLKHIDIESIQKCILDVEIDSNFLNFINEHNQNCAVVTGNLDIWIKPLVEKYDWICYSSVSEIKNGTLTGISYVMNKEDVLTKFSEKFIVSIGDGMNDYGLLKKSNLSFVYGQINNISPLLLRIADYYSTDSDCICKILRQLL